MIARLRMTPTGPERGAELGASHAPARGRRPLIVVVDEALSATMPPGSWPNPLATRETIVAQWPGAARRYARSTLIDRARIPRRDRMPAGKPEREQAGKPERPRHQSRLLLLPREAIPVIRNAGRPGGIRRAVRLRRCRFRSLRGLRRRRTAWVLLAATLLVPVLVLVTLTAPGVVPVEAARDQRSDVTEAGTPRSGRAAGPAAVPGPGRRAVEHRRPVGVLAATELARAEEAVRTRALRESRVSLPPARLLLALAAVLDRDERLLELQIDQSTVQALIAGGRPDRDGGRAELAARVGSIVGMRVIRHESREHANGMVTSVHAVLGDPEPGDHSPPPDRGSGAAGGEAPMTADERAEYVAGHVRAATRTARTAAIESGAQLQALSADPVNGTVEVAVRGIATMRAVAVAPVVGWLTALEALCERGTTVLMRMRLRASTPPLTARVVLAVPAPDGPPPFVAGATASQVRAWSRRWPTVDLHEVGARLGTDEPAQAAHARTADGHAGAGAGGRRPSASNGTAPAGGEDPREEPSGSALPANDPDRPRYLGTITVRSRRLLALMHEQTVRLVEDGGQLGSWIVDADDSAGVVPAEGASDEE